ncbi:MAG TPA: serine protease [Solirubrobacterales bacterium]|nr:serine protease [Solirubrobacterales bacterium]
MVVLLTACSAQAAPAPRVIGGGEVADPSAAPWSVQVWVEKEGGTARCSGSILDALHVLTAAHCAFVGEALVPGSAYTIIAGLAKFDYSPGEAEEFQQRKVVGVRIPPAYRPGVIHGSDAALLTLDSPLDFSRPGVQPIAVVPDGGLPPLGSPTEFFGWGLTSPDGFDRREHSLDQSLTRQWECGGGYPATICAQSPIGTTCKGDSGGGLVSATTPPVLLGVASFTITGCPLAQPDGYTNLASPEIHRWLFGDENPPLAPDSETPPILSGNVSVGGKILCNAPTWSGQPKLKSLFVLGEGGAEVEAPAAAGYRLRRSDRGKEVFCVSIATDVGGTTESLASLPRKVAGYSTELVHLRGKALRHHRWVVRLGLAGALAGERLTVVWRARGCEECRRISSVAGRRTLRLISPRRWPLNSTRLVVRLPETLIQGVRFKRSSYRLWLPAH